MGCGASSSSGKALLVPPTPEQLPAKPALDLPLWNQHCKDKLVGKFSHDGGKKWRERYHLQRSKLFPPGTEVSDPGSMENTRARYAAMIKQMAGMMRWMVRSQSLREEIVDANQYIGDRECKLRPGYVYDNTALKLLVISPKKKTISQGEGSPAIVLAAPKSLDNSDVGLFDWMGHKWAQSLGAVVVLVGFRSHPVAEHPAGVMDMVAAVKWTHAKAAELGVDASRISLATQSAGGFVACPAPFELTLRGEAELLKCVILEAPSLFPDGMFASSKDDMSEWQSYLWSTAYKTMYIGTAGDRWRELEESKDPSLFVMHVPDETVRKAPRHVISCGEIDDLAWVYCDYATKLNACGVLQDFVMVPGAAHSNMCAAIWMGSPSYYVNDFLKRAL